MRRDFSSSSFGLRELSEINKNHIIFSKYKNKTIIHIPILLYYLNDLKPQSQIMPKCLFFVFVFFFSLNCSLMISFYLKAGYQELDGLKFYLLIKQEGNSYNNLSCLVKLSFHNGTTQNELCYIWY